MARVQALRLEQRRGGEKLVELTDEDRAARETRLSVVFDPEQIDVLREYLKRIQDEAFRCKGITQRLLDFSRLGESQRKQETCKEI